MKNLEVEKYVFVSLIIFNIIKSTGIFGIKKELCREMNSRSKTVASNLLIFGGVFRVFSGSFVNYSQLNLCIKFHIISEIDVMVESVCYFLSLIDSIFKIKIYKTSQYHFQPAMIQITIPSKISTISTMPIITFLFFHHIRFFTVFAVFFISSD